jgi:SOS-response transcriptional repressor LexA
MTWPRYKTPAVRPRQLEALRTLHDLTDAAGRPPTMRELAQALRIRSLATVNYHLHILQQEGLVSVHRRHARSWVLTPAGVARLGNGPCLSTVADHIAHARTLLAALDAERIDHPYAGCLLAIDDIAEALKEVPA